MDRHSSEFDFYMVVVQLLGSTGVHTRVEAPVTPIKTPYEVAGVQQKQVSCTQNRGGNDKATL